MSKRLELIKYGLIIITCLLLSGAKIYKWVDENGQTHYSSQPPPEKTIEVKATGLSTTSQPKVIISDVIEGKWRGLVRGKLFELRLGNESALWAAVQPESGRMADIRRGKWSLLGTTITLVGSDFNNGKLNFYIKDTKENQISVLIDDDENLYRFKKLLPERWEINEEEKVLLGDWVEVKAENTSYGLAKLRFSYGQFEIYEIGRREKLLGNINPNRKKVDGNWSINEGKLSLSHIFAEGSFSKLGLKEESLEIVRLDKLAMKLKDSNGNIRSFISLEAY